ncbi:hypothetical protein EKG40_03685 [Pseudomonas moorei]|nr:hypothetical protein EKG40_03685 [Pseudomonas moorei]
MRYAVHPINKSSISPLMYEAEFGKRLDENGKKRIRIDALCPACGKGLHLVGDTDPKVDTIFSHYPKTGFCPIKESGKHKYRILPNVDEDPERARELKKSFFNNWKIHWNRFRQYAGHADIEDFITLIEYADKKNVWYYRHLEEHEVIIVFLVIKDFKPVVTHEGKVLRKHWVRFWFDSAVRGLEDFWHLPDVDKVMLKASYKVPVGEKLSPDYMMHFQVVDVDDTYLSHPVEGADTVPNYVEHKMRKTVKKHLKKIQQSA